VDGEVHVLPRQGTLGKALPTPRLSREPRPLPSEALTESSGHPARSVRTSSRPRFGRAGLPRPLEERGRLFDPSQCARCPGKLQQSHVIGATPEPPEIKPAQVRGRLAKGHSGGCQVSLFERGPAQAAKAKGTERVAVHMVGPFDDFETLETASSRLGQLTRAPQALSQIASGACRRPMGFFSLQLNRLFYRPARLRSMAELEVSPAEPQPAKPSCGSVSTAFWLSGNASSRRPATSNAQAAK
jgi:hypothetical protein